MGGFFAEAESINGSSHLLTEIAGLLHQGRLDGDLGTLARVPHSHPEVGAKVEAFARFADDQFQDLVLFLTALSTKLKATGGRYVQVDERVQRSFDQILSSETLGYDPDNLTSQQHDEVEAAAKDHRQNVFIAAEHLARLKRQTDFADVPAHEMTPEQYQELAARYNAGPHWQTDVAQAYGRGFAKDLDDAREALR